MNILMSAYACEPNKGSEPEVGWRWMIKNSKIYEKVVVVTRENNKSNIEKEFKQLNLDNVEFHYFDLPTWALFWKKGAIGVQLYSYLWEIFIFIHLFKHYKKYEFDVTQKVTFVSYRFPSFLWYYGKSFILGPIAGGERFPISFLSIFSLTGKIKELLRIILQRVSLIIDPLVLLTLYKADKIIAVTDDTKSILPLFLQGKVVIEPAISIDINDFNIQVKNVPTKLPIKLLYIGRLVEWKGIMLALKALKGIKTSQYEFNIVGEGADRKIFEDYSKNNNLNVHFLGQKNRIELSKYYSSHDIFIFPSLHDSGGMVILEAKAHFLPVIVSSFGGPKDFINKSDYIIRESTPKKFINELQSILYTIIYENGKE